MLQHEYKIAIYKNCNLEPLDPQKIQMIFEVLQRLSRHGFIGARTQNALCFELNLSGNKVFLVGKFRHENLPKISRRNPCYHTSQCIDDIVEQAKIIQKICGLDFFLHTPRYIHPYHNKLASSAYDNHRYLM